MKLRYLFYFLLFTLSRSLCAQNVVVSLDFHQVLYVGLDNPISVAVEGVKSKDIIVGITGKGNYIQKTADGKYIAKVFPQKDSNTCFINISVQSKGKVKLLSNKSYRIEFVPPGEVMFGAYTTGLTVTSYDLYLQKKLVYSNDQCVKGILNYKIDEFQFVIMPKNGTIETMTFQGDQLSENALNKIKNLHSGDIIFFQRIMAGRFHLRPIVLVVSNPLNKSVRIEGLTFHGDTIKPFWYPENTDQEMHDWPKENQKHGVWNIYRFSDKLQDYYLWQQDSFHFGQLIYKKQLSEDQLLYRVDYLQNKSIYFTLYHENGTIYQKGEVVKQQGFETVNYSKFHRELDTSLNNTKNAYQNYPLEISSSYYCTGQWKVYHPNGKIKAELNYITVEDTLRKALYMDVDNPETPSFEAPKYLLILLDGPAVFYSSDGKIEERVVFRNGYPVKR